MKRIILFSFLFVLLGSVGVLASGTDLVFFYGEGCPHCAKMELFLDEMEEKYRELNVIRYETYFDNDGREMFLKLSNAYSKEIKGVPTVFIDDEVIVGYSDSLGGEIEDKIKECVANGCSSPIEEVSEDGFDLDKVTIPAVLGAAVVDAINPCAFAVLIILLTTILLSRDRKKALYGGLVFSAAIFISYFLMGVGLYSAIKISGIVHSFYVIVAVLAILIGLFNLKDYLWYGKWFIMEVPMSWRPKLKSLIKGVGSVPGAFLIGFVVSLFLLPCTSGPYIVILGLLSKIATRDYALGLLLLYNLIFILPMLLITLGVYFGFTTTEKTEKWRKGKLKLLHLIAGIIMLLLGIGMVISLSLGVI